MQRSSDLYLESSDMLDDLQDKPYKFTSITNQHSTKNEQRIPRCIETNWFRLLLQEQEAQQVQQQKMQQLQRDMQQQHENFKAILRRDPGFVRGTDRQLMKSLSQMEAPANPFL
jgi:hypothetical protein